MPVRTENKPYGNGCRYLAARHRLLFVGNRPAPTKDEITQLVCTQGRHITWDDEEKCLASVMTCWKVEERKAAPKAAQPAAEAEEAPAPDTPGGSAEAPQ
jgi:hypothetical protein